jgi:predicted nucleic acid-binding protein
VKGFLVDTNVISEWGKPRPSAKVADFVLNSQSQQLFTCTVCFAEIRHGADSAASFELRDRLLKWLDDDLRPFFLNRVLEITEDVVLAALNLMVTSSRKRQPVHLADSLIAATAYAHRLVVATRNDKDFVPLQVAVFNPWTGNRFNGA